MHREGVDAVRRRTKIICGIVLAAAVGLGSVGVWQWNNISAALSFLRFSKAELEEQLEQKDQAIKDAVKELPDVSVRDITQEEKDALRDGTLTQEELIESLIKPQPPKEPAEEIKPDEPVAVPEPEKPKPEPEPSKPEPEPKPPEQSEYEKQLAAIIAEIYVLREQFLIRLDELLEEAKAEYKTLSPEQRSKTNMVPLVADYMARGTQLEEECDAKIVAILDRLEKLVREHNGDTKLSQKIFDTYVDEKSIKKAWYMAELKEKGLV